MFRNKEFWIINIILLAVLFWYFYPLLPFNAFYLAGTQAGNDLTNFMLPVKEIYRQALLSGKLPLWTNLLYTGYPLFAEGQVGALFPLNLFLFRFFDTITAIKISLFLTFYWAGLGMFYWLRSKVSFLAAVWGSVTLVLSGFFISHTQHLNMLQVVSFFPWLLLLLKKYLQQRKTTHLILLTICIPLLIFLGQQQIFFYLGVVLALWGLYQALMGVIGWIRQIKFKTQNEALFTPQTLRQRLIFFSVTAIFVLLGLGISAVQILPSLELKALSNRAEPYKISLEPGPKHVASFYFPIEYLKTFWNPFSIGNPALGYISKTPGVYYHETLAFVGKLTLVLAMIGVLLIGGRRGRREAKPRTVSHPSTGSHQRLSGAWVIFWLSIGIVVLLLAFGNQTALVKILALPGFNQFRVPARLIFFTGFSLIVLACYGLNWLFSRIKSRFALISISCLLFTIHFFDLSQTFVLNPVHPQARQLLYTSQIGKFLQETDPNARIWSVYEQAIYELSLAAQGWNTLEKKDLFANQFNQLPGSVNVLNNLRAVDGYVGLEPLRIQELFFTGESLIWDNFAKVQHLAKLMGISYLITPRPVDDAGSPILVVNKLQKDDPSYYVYQIGTKDNRFRLVPKARRIIANQGIKEYVFNPDHDFSSVVLLDQVVLEELGLPYTLTPAEVHDWGSEKISGQVKLVSEGSDHLKLRVQTDADGFLVVADHFYPGWKAYVDDKETEIYRADYSFRTIKLPPGDHEVVFEYQPESFKRGRVISLVSLSLFAILSILLLIKHQVFNNPAR